MNESEIKGIAKDVSGKAQETFGQVIGNENQQAKGQAKQIEGKLEKTVGDVKEFAKLATDRL